MQKRSLQKRHGSYQNEQQNTKKQAIMPKKKKKNRTKEYRTVTDKVFGAPKNPRKFHAYSSKQ